MKVRFYFCEHCKNVVYKPTDSGAPVSCCGQPMKELIPGTTDGAMEKHIPVGTVEGNSITIKVGEAEHPMVDMHYIMWIALLTTEGLRFKHLNPGDKPEATFTLADGEEAIVFFSYCNLHSLWISK